MATLTSVLAVAMSRGPQAGLALLDSLAGDERVARHHRWYAMRAHLLDMAGETNSARQAFEEAARRTTSLQSGVVRATRHRKRGAYSG